VAPHAASAADAVTAPYTLRAVPPTRLKRKRRWTAMYVAEDHGLRPEHSYSAGYPLVELCSCPADRVRTPRANSAPDISSADPFAGERQGVARQRRVAGRALKVTVFITRHDHRFSRRMTEWFREFSRSKIQPAAHTTVGVAPSGARRAQIESEMMPLRSADQRRDLDASRWRACWSAPPPSTGRAAAYSRPAARFALHRPCSSPTCYEPL